MDHCPSSILAQHPKKAKKFFNSNGELRNISKLRYWTLEQVLRDKYEMKKFVLFIIYSLFIIYYLLFFIIIIYYLLFHFKNYYSMIY